MNGTIILGVDNGYGNVKTAHRVFQTGIMKCDSEPVLTKEYIEYDGAYYIIGEGHKGFVADKQEDDDTYVRSFLGRMLFTGDEALKPCNVLSGGERVRVVLARMMLEGANCMIFDEPTSHLDLESIQALNNGIIEFKGVVLFNSHDHQFVDSIANRIIEFTPDGLIDKLMSFEDYINDESINAQRAKAYKNTKQVVLI